MLYEFSPTNFVFYQPTPEGIELFISFDSADPFSFIDDPFFVIIFEEFASFAGS